MDVAIVGATGSCGRQLAAQLLEQRVLPPSARLQLVGHRGGRHEHELWGLRADLEDAFEDGAPSIELVLDPPDVHAGVVVILAGATVSTDPDVSADRGALGRTNLRLFEAYADALAGRPGPRPTIIVQSNPVELGVAVFAERLGRHHVLGAGAHSDTLRLRAEIAADLGIRRPQVAIPMLGQHGDHLVPAWSLLEVRDDDPSQLGAYVERVRAGRTLSMLPSEVASAKARMLEAVRAGRIDEAYAAIAALPPDVRAAVKPFFTHFTSGHTTEMVAARAVADIVTALLSGEARVMPAQIVLEGEWLGIEGVVGAPVVLGPGGWSQVFPVGLAADEVEALRAAAHAIAAAITAADAALTEPVADPSTRA